jgi:hypothetical protein
MKKAYPLNGKGSPSDNTDDAFEVIQHA